MNLDNQLYQAAVRRQMAAAQAPPPPAYYAPPFYAPNAPDFYAQQAPPPAPQLLAVANIGPNAWTPQDITSIVNRQEKLIEALMQKQDKMVERQDKMFEVMTQQMMVCVAKQNQQMEENAKNMQEMFKLLMGALTNYAIGPAPPPAPTSEHAPALTPTPAPAPVIKRAVSKATRSAPYRKRQQPERKIIESKGCTLGEASEYNEGKKCYRKYSCAKCERTFLSLSGLKGHFTATHQ